MPIYEYLSEKDGAVIELVRPMADADKPFDDPENKGRVFKRKLSTFAAKSGSAAAGASPVSGGGGCCPCGKSAGGCGRGM